MIPKSLYRLEILLGEKNNGQNTDLEKKTAILLADDSKDMLAMLSSNLVKRGYDVLTYENKLSAIIELKRMNEQGEELPLVISDVMSPVMDGFEFLRRTKELFPEIKFMFLTASREEEYINRARHMSANAYATKPVDFAVICQSIERVLAGESFFSVN